MNNIKSEEDIVKWASEIVGGGGEKFIPLSKSDMFAIATFILESRNGAAEGSIEEDGKKPESGEYPVPTPETWDRDPPPYAEATATTTSSVQQERTTSATMTRGYAFHRAGFTPQQAYDKFLEWAKEHPKEAAVMDFSNGVKSNNAAFAYWLCEIITIDIPTTHTTTYN